jgi:hypothetical protein
VLISPHHHQLHHSADPRHAGKNLGGILSIWDRMFGTYWDEDVQPGALSFGLGAEDPYQDRILPCYTYPFLSMWRRAVALFQTPPPKGKSGTPTGSSEAA